MPTVLVRVLCVTLASVLFFVVGCSRIDNALAPQETGTGIALLKILAAPNTPFSRIAHTATATVSASDMLTITSNLTVTDSSVEGTIIGIPAGKNRLFFVAVYDSLDTLQYRGSATSDVQADTSVVVALSVSRVSGSAIINGTVNEGDSIPTTGLIAYYPFNGNPNDASGHGYNGTASNVTLEMDRFGQANKAYRSRGGKIIVSNFPFDGSTGQMTISAWIMPDTGWGTNSNATEAIVTHDVGTFSFFVEQSGTGNGIFHYWVFQTNQQNNPNATTTFLFEKSKWYHLVIVANAGQEIVMFINNQKILTGKNCPPVIYTSTAPLLLGGGQVGSFLNGRFDDIRIYNSALTETQVGALYHEGGWTGN